MVLDKDYDIGLDLNGRKVLLAVSGGMDSIVMLDWFHWFADRLGVEVGVAHVDHCIRGDESHRDARFVESIAEDMGLPFHSTELSWVDWSSEDNIEASARKYRYDFLLRIKREYGYDYVCTAHHANDMYETIWMATHDPVSGRERKCSDRAMGGIQAVRDDGVFRPFLRLTHGELESYALARNLAWVHDSTNDDTSYYRNRVRKSSGATDDEIREAVDKALAAQKRYAEIREATLGILAGSIEYSGKWGRYGCAFQVDLRSILGAGRLVPHVSLDEAVEKVLPEFLRSRGVPCETNDLSGLLSSGGRTIHEGVELSVADRVIYVHRTPSDVVPYDGLRYEVRPGKSRKVKRWFSEHKVPQFVRVQFDYEREGLKLIKT